MERLLQAVTVLLLVCAPSAVVVTELKPREDALEVVDTPRQNVPMARAASRAPVWGDSLPMMEAAGAPTSAVAPPASTSALVPPSPVPVEREPSASPARVASAGTRAPAKPAKPAEAAPQPPTEPAGMAPYYGLGTWVDVYDWSETYTRDGAPQVGPAQVDAMAEQGVQTLFIQASKHDSPTHVLEQDRLLSIVDRAHGHGIRVVAWYLPTFEDPARDVERMVTIASLRVDGIGVDIESRAVSDVAERNRRLVQVSAELRSRLPGRVISGIVLPAVVLEEVNAKYWPDFPYREIASSYDVWQPMSYWTNRKSSSGWRDARAYTNENVIRLRRNLGQPNATVSPIGGLGDTSTMADMDGFIRSVRETHSIGGGIYDWRITSGAQWAKLRELRA